MLFGNYAVYTTAALFVGMLIIARWGYGHGRARLKRDPNLGQARFGTIEAAVFALLGLMLAFTYSTAYGRLEIRRHLIVQEANAISTTFLRLELLPEYARVSLKKKLVDYTDAKLRIWRKLPNVTDALKEYENSLVLQKDIWREVVQASSEPEYQAMRILVLPPLNEFIDLSLDRLVSMQNHAPWIIFVLIYCLALACAWMAGYGQTQLDHYHCLHIVVFSFLIASTVYIIQDLEYPSLGLIKLDAVNEIFHRLTQDFQRGLVP